MTGRVLVCCVLLLQVLVAFSTPVDNPMDITEFASNVPQPDSTQTVINPDVQKKASGESVLLKVIFQGNSNDTSIFHPHKQKRGWAAAIFKGLMVAEHLTNLGLNLAQAVEGGCVYYPSICSDREDIKTTDARIQKNLDKFDAEFKSSKVEYLALRQVSTNNAYINYYINSTIRAVESLKKIQQTILLQMEQEYPELAKMAEAGHQTADEYLRSLLGPIEFTLSDINEMLKAERKEAFIGLVIEVSVETAIGGFIKGYQKTYNEIKSIDKLAIKKGYYGLLDENGVKLEPSIHKKYIAEGHTPSKVLGDIKTVPKVLGKMVKSTFIEKPTNLVHAVTEMGNIKTWDGFKDTFSHVLRKPLATLKKVGDFFKSPSFSKFNVEDFKIGWTEGLMSTITVISDAISQAMAAKQYKEAAKQVSDTKDKYHEYDKKLKDELAEIAEERAEMNDTWSQSIDSFKNSSSIFKDLIRNALNYANFSDALGESNLEVDLNNPLFSTNLNNVQRNNLEEKQNAIIGYLRSVNNDMNTVRDKLRSRQTLYSIVLRETNQSTTIAEILKTAHQAYEFDQSATVKSYGHNLTEKDIVCSVAILRPTLTIYNSFDLVAFRPHCNVTHSAFTKMQSAALAKQKNTLLFQTVKSNILPYEKSNATGPPLNILYSLIVGQYAHGDDSKVSKDDVLCAIAHEFPAMESYDSHPLSPVRNRPECSPN